MTTNIADAFDLVGKRWALQVVRELALGPQRYTDLRRRLAGISTNVLPPAWAAGSVAQACVILCCAGCRVAMGR